MVSGARFPPVQRRTAGDPAALCAPRRPTPWPDAPGDPGAATADPPGSPGASERGADGRTLDGAVCGTAAADDRQPNSSPTARRDRPQRDHAHTPGVGGPPTVASHAASRVARTDPALPGPLPISLPAPDRELHMTDLPFTRTVG